MANACTKIYIQAVFAVKNRQALLSKKHRPEIFKYMAGILDNRGHKSLAVNGYHDHVHLLFDFKPNEDLSSLIREIKKSSNIFIKENKFTPFKFEWQSGYGGFSHGYRELDAVIKYIMNQKEHHSKTTFQQEYFKFLKAYDIEYKDKYVFEFFDDGRIGLK
jgi:putative transposase